MPSVFCASSQAISAETIGLRAKAMAMPVEKCSDGAASAAAAMFIHGTWWPSVNSMPEKPAASVRRASVATWSQVVARVMTSNSMVFFLQHNRFGGTPPAGVCPVNDAQGTRPSVRNVPTASCRSAGCPGRRRPFGIARACQVHPLLVGLLPCAERMSVAASGPTDGEGPGCRRRYRESSPRPRTARSAPRARRLFRHHRGKAFDFNGRAGRSGTYPATAGGSPTGRRGPDGSAAASRALRWQRATEGANDRHLRHEHPNVVRI